MACRRSIADKPRYQSLATHLPLAAPYRATVAQLTDTHLPTGAEAADLLAWTADNAGCRQTVMATIARQSPAALANVLIAWSQEDAIYVQLIQRKLAWGVAAARLRTTQVELLSKLTDQAMQISAQLNSMKQAGLSRRVAIFDALTNLAP